MYDTLRFRLVRDTLFFFLEGSGARDGSSDVYRSSSSSLAWCLVDLREGAKRFPLELCSISELPDKSSLLLGSLYDTAPRLRFALAAMVVLGREYLAVERLKGQGVTVA